MISKFENKYCCDNPLLIEGRDEALKDHNECYKLVHRNLFTQLGTITPQSLRRMGMFWNRPAKELIYMTRDEYRKCVALHRNRCIKLPGGTKGKVFEVFNKLHPDRLFFTLTPEDFFHLANLIDTLRNRIKSLKWNVENDKRYKFKIYDQWIEDNDKFIEWALQNGFKDPNDTIERFDKDGDWVPENLAIIHH